MTVAEGNLKENVSSVVSRKKIPDGGFLYVCGVCDHECQGRKGIVTHVKEDHEEIFNEFKGEQDGKEFESAFSKQAMTAPFFEDRPTNKFRNGESEELNGDKEKEDEEDEKEEVELKTIQEKKTKEITKSKAPVGADYPETLGAMKTIDARTKRLPDFGSLNGRIARIVAIVVSKEEEDDGSVVLKDRKLDGNPIIGEAEEVYSYLEEHHKDFVENLSELFPQAKKRMNQFVERAVTNFEMKVPTEKDVKAARAAEEEKKKKEREAEMAKEKEARLQALKERKEKEEKLRAERKEAMKRKLEEQKEKSKKLAEEMAKKRKMEENKPASPEEMERRKKEIATIKKNLQDALTEVRRNRLEKRLKELEAKVLKDEKGKQEAQIKKRTEDALDILSPKQLRKLCMTYFENVKDFENFDWLDLATAIKMDDDLEFIVDFCALLYDTSKLYEQKSFKIGHILVTSKQAEAIVEKGIVSYRDFVKDDSWRIPSAWDVDIPSEDLGDDWNRKDDSRLLIGASRFGKNLAKIVTLYPNMKAKVQDDDGKVKDVVKKRFAYLLNVYQNRGTYVEDLGLNLYNVDVLEEENCVEQTIQIIEETNGKESNGKEEDKESPEKLLEKKDGEDQEMADEEIDEEELLAEDN